MTEFEYVGKLLLPRLPKSAAREQFVENSSLALADLADSGSVQHAAAAPAPVGGHPASVEHLKSVQRAIRDLASEYGFPKALSPRDQAAFDRACGTLLLSNLDVVTGDAASAEVWAFVSLVLVPEIPFWRFPGAADERYLGGQRNTLQRLWWRAWTFGPDLAVVPSGAAPFGEDDFVQVMERPTVSGNRRLARTFYEVVLASDLDDLGMTRSNLVRRLVMRIRALRAHIAVDALEDDELRTLITQVRDSIRVASK